MNKKNGFTLVEFLGVITILAMLGVIIVPTINNVISENRKKLYDTQIRNIKASASNFVSENILSLDIEKNESLGITLGMLKELGYIDKNITNPITRESFDNDLVIIITNNESGFEYTVCTSDNLCDIDYELYQEMI